MPLEGLRAWIGEVERKLGARTRAMLALAAIAIGIAGAALYLAIDAHDTAVSEADVQGLQRQLEERIDQVSAEAGGGGEGDVTRLESEVQALRGEVEALKKEGSAKKGSTGTEPGTEGSTGKGATTEGTTPGVPEANGSSHTGSTANAPKKDQTSSSGAPLNK